MSGLRGDVGKLRSLEKRLRELPLVLAQKVAAASADAITDLARATFNAGENAYGDTWEPGADGRHVTLRKSGRTAGGVRYVAIGTRLRAQLGAKYVRYQVGRRPIFPRNGARLPISYVATIGAKTGAVVRAELGKAG